MKQETFLKLFEESKMAKKTDRLSRRDFLRIAGSVGIGTIMASSNGAAGASDAPMQVPTRPFGKTGVDIPILGFGGSLNVSLNLLMLRQAVKWGVTYWDTANSYMGGNSEKGIGKYLGRYPEDRKKIFLVTKSHAWTLRGMARDLNESLERMKTDFVDLFFVHAVRKISELDEDTKAWAERAKSEGKIRFFGFSTHSNMENCLLGAAKLGWVDAIMMTYNYRLMHSGPMKRAVDACAKAGIGLTAMKTQGGGQVRTETEPELQLGGRFLKKGFTEGQAKLKAVWENPYIASICSEMPNMTLLMSNAAAAVDRKKLADADKVLLQRYACETAAGYCAGCAHLCESATGRNIPVGDVMRYLMYARSYGEPERASACFEKIPLDIRKLMARLDYSAAEQMCPRKVPIGRLMREAVTELI
jgi:predicted aldo/keto reductase-like oxidoreductase